MTNNRAYELIEELLERYKNAKPVFRVRPKHWYQWINPWWWRKARVLEKLITWWATKCL